MCAAHGALENSANKLPQPFPSVKRVFAAFSRHALLRRRSARRISAARPAASALHPRSGTWRKEDLPYRSARAAQRPVFPVAAAEIEALTEPQPVCPKGAGRSGRKRLDGVLPGQGVRKGSLQAFHIHILLHLIRFFAEILILIKRASP